MKVAIAYVFPNMLQGVYVPAAKRFVGTYMDFTPGQYDHDLHVMVNGDALTDRQKKLFDPLPVQFHQHNNFAKDIGAFMVASAEIDCDLLVCFGSHVHFRRGGWLDRMMEIYVKNGPGLYGCWGYDTPAYHIRTTAFWLPPELLYTYPHTLENRYAFEHGKKESILKWAIDCGLPVATVGWTRVMLYPDFDHVPNEECLMLDQHTDRIGFK